MHVLVDSIGSTRGEKKSTSYNCCFEERPIVSVLCSGKVDVVTEITEVLMVICNGIVVVEDGKSL